MKKNIHLVIIIFYFITFFLFLNCSSLGKNDGTQYKNLSGNLLNKRIEKINSDNIKYDHGYIVLNFKSVKNTFWFVTLTINGNKYFYNSLFFSRKPERSKSVDDLIEYKITIPSGKISILYELYSSDRIDEYTTNIGFFGFFKDGKILDLIIENDKVYKLNLVQLKKDIPGLGWAGGGGCVIPFPKIYHEVAFEVEQIKDQEKGD